MVNLVKFLMVGLLIMTSAWGSELLDIGFQLKPKKDECEVYGPVLNVEEPFAQVDRFLKEKDTVVIYPQNMETLGMTAKAALEASGDQFSESACSEDHTQGDMANRWCHSALARTFSNFLEKKGVSKALATLAGGVFWAPKELFYDLNPSAGDFVITYQDKLDSKRTTFEVTVYGDALFKNKQFGKIRPFAESTPFISIRRVLGPQVTK